MNKFIKILIVLSVFFLNGCASSLISKPEEINQLKKGNGVVFGSLRVNLKEVEGFEVNSLTNSSWLVLAISKDLNYFTRRFKHNHITLKLDSDSIEVPFIASLSEGEYEIHSIKNLDGALHLTMPVHVNFEVKENTTYYIGRINITVPSKFGAFDSIAWRSPIDVKIENNFDETYSLLSKKYGNNLGGNIQEKFAKR